MEFRPRLGASSHSRFGAPTASFKQALADGAKQTVSVTVHATEPFLSAGIGSFTFEVCRLVKNERSRFHCNIENLFIDPAETSQREATRWYTIDDGPGTYQARFVVYGTFFEDDKVYSSARFTVE